jgi:hypothetical protein
MKRKAALLWLSLHLLIKRTEIGCHQFYRMIGKRYKLAPSIIRIEPASNQANTLHFV